MEARISITIDEHGRDEATMERVLEAFLKTAAETGPVVAGNVATGALTVTFALEAVDFDDLKARAASTFVEGMTASGLALSEVLDVDIEALSAAAELRRELQPA
jgi:hypothetical protein